MSPHYKVRENNREGEGIMFLRNVSTLRVSRPGRSQQNVRWINLHSAAATIVPLLLAVLHVTSNQGARSRNTDSAYLSNYTASHTRSLSLFPVAPTLEHRTSVKRLILRQSVGLHGQGMSPSLGRYLQKTTQTQNADRHPCLEWDSNPQSQRSRVRRQFKSQTARPL
jgi:hypothetical protein